MAAKTRGQVQLAGYDRSTPASSAALQRAQPRNETADRSSLAFEGVVDTRSNGYRCRPNLVRFARRLDDRGADDPRLPDPVIRHSC